MALFIEGNGADHEVVKLLNEFCTSPFAPVQPATVRLFS